MAIIASTTLTTKYGEFDVRYHHTNDGGGLSITTGEFKKGEPLLRIHSSCLFSESFHSITCDCATQLQESLRLIGKDKNGVVVYLFDEGRGAGLITKIKAMELERKEGIDTVGAFDRLGLPPDLRSYQVALQILNDINMSKVLKLITNNPNKKTVLENSGYKISKIVGLKLDLSESAKDYLKMKKEKLGHKYINID